MTRLVTADMIVHHFIAFVISLISAVSLIMSFYYKEQYVDIFSRTVDVSHIMLGLAFFGIIYSAHYKLKHT